MRETEIVIVTLDRWSARESRERLRSWEKREKGKIEGPHHH